MKRLLFLLISHEVTQGQNIITNVTAGQWTDPTVWSLNTIPIKSGIIYLNHNIFLQNFNVIETLGSLPSEFNIVHH